MKSSHIKDGFLGLLKNRYFMNLLKYLLAFGLLAFVIYTNWGVPDGNGLAYVWQKHIVEGVPIRYHFLGLAALSYSIAVSITFFRWYVLVRAVGLPFKVSNAYRLGLVGLFFNSFLPGSVGGDIIKAAFIAREQNRRTVAVATVLIDRALALWALVWFVALIGTGFWITGQLVGRGEDALKSIVVTSCTIVAISAVAWALLGLLSSERAENFAKRLHTIPKIGLSAAELWRAVWIYRCRQKSVALAMGIALVAHVFFTLTFYFSALVLSGSDQSIPTWQAHFLIVPIGMIIEAMPLFPGGAGIGEAGFGGLYALIGATAAAGVLGSLVQRVIKWVIGFFGYLVYMRLKSTHHPAPAQSIELQPVEV